jgi:hypothetical protein
LAILKLGNSIKEIILLNNPKKMTQKLVRCKENCKYIMGSQDEAANI